MEAKKIVMNGACQYCGQMKAVEYTEDELLDRIRREDKVAEDIADIDVTHGCNCKAAQAAREREASLYACDQIIEEMRIILSISCCIQCIDLFDQPSVLLRRNIFRFQECIDDVIHQEYTCDLSSEAQNICVQFLLCIDSSRHITHQRCPDARYLVCSIVDAYTCTADADAQICLSLRNRFACSFSEDRVMRAELIISAAVDHFMSQRFEMF